MIKMIFLVHRRQELSREGFRQYWRETHASIASKIPGLRKYIQHHAVPGPDGADPPYDGFSEMWWDNAESLKSALESPEGKAAVADIGNIVEVERQQVFAVEQHSVV